MAYINVPDDLLKPSELKELEDGIKKAAEEKRRTGWMTMDKFMGILKSACRWIWDKISGFITDIWYGICDLFS